MIGDDIEIVIVEIKGDQVKLGIKAPRNVTVHRSEVYQEIQQQNQEAAVSNVKNLEAMGKLLKKKPGGSVDKK